MFDGDELAGIVEQFGALSRAELERAVEELAFKRGEAVEPGAVADRIEAAVEELRLVPVEREGTRLFAPGPTAFPALPAGAEDLPHILEVEERAVDRAQLARSAERRLREAAAAATAANDRERMAALLDYTYDLETWAPEDVAVESVRERLDAARSE